jgi:hypothetical protein
MVVHLPNKVLRWSTSWPHRLTDPVQDHVVIRDELVSSRAGRRICDAGMETKLHAVINKRAPLTGFANYTAVLAFPS